MTEKALEKSFKDEVIAEARKRAIGWSVTAFSTLALAAFTGWWLFLEPKIVKRLGGIPPGAILAFENGCPDAESWQVHEGSKGRFLIGAGGKVFLDAGSATQTESDLVPGISGVSRLRSAVRLLPNPPINPNTPIDPTGMSVLLTRNTPVTRLQDSPDGAIQYGLLPPYHSVVFCKKK